MEHKYKQYITIVIAWLIILGVGVSLVGFAGAQETGEGSATIEYDYNTEEISYDIDLSEPSDFSLGDIYGEQENSVNPDNLEDPSGTVRWVDNGSSLFVGGNGVIIQYNTDGAYEYSGFNEVGRVTLNSSSTNPTDFRIGNDGQSIYYVQSGDEGSEQDNNNDMMYQINLGTSYDIGSVQSTDSMEFSTPSVYNFEIESLDLGSEGSYIFFNSHTGEDIRSYPRELPTNWDITSAEGYDFGYSSPWNEPLTDMSLINDTTLLYSTENSESVSMLHSNEPWLDWTSNVETTVTENRNVGTHVAFDVNPNAHRLDVSKSASDSQVEIGSYHRRLNARFYNSNGNEISFSEDLSNIDTEGTVSFSPSVRIDGLYMQWNFAGTDVSGTSNSISIYGDGEIDIREEQTNNLVTESVNVTAYGEESGIYSLDTSDGTIDISGLPDQAYTFAVSSGGYYQRVRYTNELGNEDNFYLLDNSTDTVTSQFTLEDRTGVYDQDSRLVIRRSIEGNGNEWQTIISDSFGSEGLTLDLQENVRYRLYVETDTQTQLIGPYRASISETVTVSPTSGEIDVGGGEYWSAGASYGKQDVDVRFVDPTEQTDSVSVTVYERGNESNVLIDGDTYSNPSDLQLEYDVSDQYNESNWIVELTIERGTETYTTSFNVGPTADIVPTELDSFWRKIFGVMIMLTFGMIFSIRNKAVGSIVYACVGGMLYWIGLLEGLTTGGLIVGYFFIVIIYNIYLKS